SLGALAPDPNYMPRVPGATLRLRDAYLKEWAGYCTESELLKAFELSQPLGFLHSALTHYKFLGKIIPVLRTFASAVFRTNQNSKHQNDFALQLKYVLPGLELKAKAEMENMVGFYLRLVLEHKSWRTQAQA